MAPAASTLSKQEQDRLAMPPPPAPQVSASPSEEGVAETADADKRLVATPLAKTIGSGNQIIMLRCNYWYCRTSANRHVPPHTNTVFLASHRQTPPGGGHSLIWPIWGHVAGQGMVFGLSALNRVCNFR